MPSDDYSSSIGGGLKLKGVSGGAIKKSKKKGSKKNGSSNSTKKPVDATAIQKALEDEDAAASTTAPGAREDELREAEEDLNASKTEAEKRKEEMRRKRLAERLEKEGVKTHKERVEELNKYLSNLSEHHDMPRIGPG
ncbi:hypothetical protein PVAG01_01760 [Phlyctema vagabunda]|uniref:DUF1754-domain-containing protein n=1 Tax=Phlyctema vagabunda TaxID=108571 RepID=A0ABR4PY28_9HELO